MRNVFLTIFTALAFVSCQPAYCYPTDSIRLLPEDVMSVYDGDTIYVNVEGVPDIFGLNVGIRLKGLDTPEIKSNCPTETERLTERNKAYAAREYLRERIFTAKRIVLLNMSRDRYFRIDADVYIDGVNVNQELVDKGFAVLYDGGTKATWCGK